ncbi:MAG: hypothetical protein ABIO72_04900 [Patescibacteria group bacterium]
MILRPSQWLFIDTSITGVCRVGMLTSHRRTVTELKARSGALLPAIAKLGARTLKQMTGVCVVQGPGSFSSVRAGVLIANLLSRTFHVPLVGIDVKEADNLDQVWDNLEHGRIATRSFVEPVYDAEPNITVART